MFHFLFVLHLTAREKEEKTKSTAEAIKGVESFGKNRRKCSPVSPYILLSFTVNSQLLSVASAV